MYTCRCGIKEAAPGYGGQLVTAMGISDVAGVTVLQVREVYPVSRLTGCTPRGTEEPPSPQCMVGTLNKPIEWTPM